MVSKPFALFFWLLAARVCVPDGSSFSQLQLHETDKSKFVRKKIIKGQKNELMNQKKSKTNNPPRSASETRDPFRSRVINGPRRKENRCREAIGFEIPVTKGAFNRKEKGGIDDIRCHKSNKQHSSRCPVKHGSRKLYISESWRAFNLALGETA